MSLTAKDVSPQADAMDSIEAALSRFPTEHQIVILSGVLGSVLCRTGAKPSRSSAILFVGMAMNAVFDMIHMHFPKEKT